MIWISRVMDFVRAYSQSSWARPAKEIWFRPLTCHGPVIPGFNEQ
jgi:hypothetical protein